MRTRERNERVAGAEARLLERAQSGIKVFGASFVRGETCCTLLPPSHLKTSDEGNAPNRMVVVGSALDTRRSPFV